MSFQRPILALILLCACDTLATESKDASAPRGGRAEPEPLSADLIAACPESEGFDRTSKHICTEIGCSSGYNLNVSPASGWAMGAYTFELTVDGRKVTCQGSLPLKTCGEPSFSCDADGVRLGESGCALPADQQGIADIKFEGYPLALTVRVLKDGTELSNSKLDPKYAAGQPNGPGCEPICCSATGALDISASL
ncbi:MAG TPA: hypothetical protein VFN67_13090 [Polyangiales bacterium]|nr:hypothetical protein [Polyangiales bacterium]